MSTDIRAIRSLKKKLIAEISKEIEPFLYESGYRTGPIGKSEPMKVWVPRGSDGKPTFTAFKLRDGFVVEEFEGFHRDGVILESNIGCVTIGYSDMPVEDLVKLKAWVDKNLVRLTAFERTRDMEARGINGKALGAETAENERERLAGVAGGKKQRALKAP